MTRQVVITEKASQASRLPPATSGSQSSYTTREDTTSSGPGTENGESPGKLSISVTTPK